MIKRFENYIKESLDNDDYKKTFTIIKQLVDNGDIELKGKSVEQITDLIVGKEKKYPQFGFENFIINAANGNFFVSEGDRQRMGEYIERISKLGIDTTKLEKLYLSVKKQLELELNEIDNIHMNPDLTKKQEEEELNKIYDEINRLQPDIDKFYSILTDISKEVEKHL